jgi:hypothetical protein
LTETLVEGFVPMDEGCVYMRWRSGFDFADHGYNNLEY